MRSGSLRVGLAWFVFFASCALTYVAGTLPANAEQVQARIPVSAFVLVSSSISSTLSASLAPSPSQSPSSPASQGQDTHDAGDGGNSGKPSAPSTIEKPKPICAAVSVSCSGRAPLRVSVEGATEDAQECAQHGATGAQSLSLCSSNTGPQNSLGVSIEY